MASEAAPWSAGRAKPVEGLVRQRCSVAGLPSLRSGRAAGAGLYVPAGRGRWPLEAGTVAQEASTVAREAASSGSLLGRGSGPARRAEGPPGRRRSLPLRAAGAVIGALVGCGVWRAISPGVERRRQLACWLAADSGCWTARQRPAEGPLTARRRLRPPAGRSARGLVVSWALSRQAAEAVLGVGVGASLEEVRRAFRARARRTHPDGGGSAEAFRELREAYALLRWGSTPSRGSRRAEDVAEDGPPRAGDAEWSRWEEEVRRGRELAGEDDVIYWRPEPSESWRPAKVLAVQVVYEPSSGPHGWIYLQPLVEEAGDGVFQEDEEAEMEQVEPLSPDGVNWCFAPSATPLGYGRWRLGPRPPLP
uniref:J domain-containing protein n=1 Tax=Alexandrium monilatum TaxID=311494 RepID=A0A7S4Q5E0_9DINO